MTELCGVENPDYPGEYSCTYPKGHGPISLPNDDELLDHAAPESGAWWNMPVATKEKTLTPEERLHAIVALWDGQISRGFQFLANPALVPEMRKLLDGYGRYGEDE